MSFLVKQKISETDLMNDKLAPQEEVSNGLIIDLYNFMKDKDLSRGHLRKWISILVGRDLELNSLMTRVHRLVSKSKSLRGLKSQELKNDTFILPEPKKEACKTAFESASLHVSKEIIALNKELLKEVSASHEEVKEVTAQKRKLREEKRNVERRLETKKRKLDILPAKSAGQEDKEMAKKIENLERRVAMVQQQKQKHLSTIVKYRQELKQERLKLTRAHKSRAQMMEEVISTKGKLAKSEACLAEVRKEKDKLEKDFNCEKVNCDYLQSLISDNSELLLFDETTDKFTPQTRECVMNLTNLSVATKNVPGVIREVSKLCGKEPNRLPARQTVDDIVQSKVVLAHKQLSQVLPDKASTTLMSDETSKFGAKYEVYLASDENKDSYLMGLREISDKTARTTLETFKEILHDIESTCVEYENEGKEANIGYRILAGIRDTMSDRAATEKAFNKLLEEYRASILPKVKDGWKDMSPEEQQKCSKLNNYFCALHLLVAMAEVCSASVRNFEKTSMAGDSSSQGNEAGTVEMIRMSAKAFSRGGDERSGCHQAWKTYTKQENKKVLFVNFKGNRFNIMFYVAQVLFYHHEMAQEFLKNVNGLMNRLLESLSKSLECPLYISCCRVLGLLAKLITSPFWRIVENCNHVLDLNEQYLHLSEYLGENASDPEPTLLSGQSPFDDVWIEKDYMLDALLQGAQDDSTAVQLTHVLCLALQSLLKRMVADQLPGGKYFTKTEELVKETSSVISHNKLPEFVFGILDHLVRFRPNATVLTNEAFLMYSYNKTGQWLAEIPEEERSKLIESARKATPQFKKMFKERKTSIEEKRREALKKKAEEIRRKRQKLVEEKEKMSSKVVYYGLWQTQIEVEQKLSEFTVKEQVEALKSQLNFRKKVLHQDIGDKTVFAFSVKSKKHGVEQLKSNVLRLVKSAQEGVCEESLGSNRPLLVGKRVLHKFDEGEWIGKVISVVPGYVEWYNIIYEGQDSVYTYRLQEDYSKGDLRIMIGNEHPYVEQ